MYLSNRDIKWAIDCGKLTVDPRPENYRGPRGNLPSAGYDETSIDLHLVPLSENKGTELPAAYFSVKVSA
jgi:hypothetical protein